ncbi:general transcription factor 3C polypeptide 5 isoform X2 [Ctenocephalides felis]|uniref:general transcription factor 3C polypeptide 5 isoform X2 n=1 Tax=Ctenocephalides felis TaxID=7515 RepID=UPI000E6E514D|nr:general transcription factor 3C polypeptide 5 isoform X2 [Ctenocephalides felis]
MNKISLDLFKSLVCIEYPGIVQNVDNMLETLGGVRNLSMAYCTKNRRLELRFRPKDIYCKPTCGDKYKTNALIIKVKIKRPKSKESTQVPEVVSCKIIGRVHTIYKFTDKDVNGSLKCYYDEIVPLGLPSAAWMGADAPLFLTPATFSRIDNQQNLSLALDSYTKDSADATHNVIGRTRRRRSGYAIFLSFKNAPEVAPKAPNRKCLNLLQVKFLDGTQLNTLKKLFEERPIWSKNALLYNSGYSIDKLKYLLPAVAYYYVTGPWRSMWIRFGYDPRLDYQSRKYQTLDYRLRTTGGYKTAIKAKRSSTNYVLPYKTGSTCKPKTVVLGKTHRSKKIKTSNRPTKLNENIYIFRQGMVPPSRQMFYQYCDVSVPEIVTMLARLPVPIPGVTKCDQRRGWLPAGFDDRCREIIHALVIEEIQKRKESSSTDKNLEMSELNYGECEEEVDLNEESHS